MRWFLTRPIGTGLTSSNIFRVGRARSVYHAHIGLLFKRKLTGTATACLMLMGFDANALGLGDLEHQSYLGQPLQATVKLVGASELDDQQLRLRRIHGEEAEELGVELLSNAYRFQFELDTSASGERFFRVSSMQPINEPYVDLMLRLEWPEGTLVREYALLLDAAPLRPRAEAQVRQQNDTAVPTQSPSNAGLPALSAGRYRVQSGDTLSKIVSRLDLPDNVSSDQAMQQLLQSNPRAFIDQKAEGLMAGALLVIPDRFTPNGGGSGRTSLQSNARSDVSATQRTPVATTTKEPSGALRLSNPLSSASNGDVAMRERIDSTQEMVDLLVEENRELRERIQRIESSEYLNTLAELIAVQRKQIEDLQAAQARTARQNPVRSEASAPVAAPVSTPMASPVNFGLLISLVVLSMLFIGASAIAIYLFVQRRKQLQVGNAYVPAPAHVSERHAPQVSDEPLDVAAPSANVTTLSEVLEKKRHKQLLNKNPEKDAADSEVHERIRLKTDEYNKTPGSAQAPARLQDVEIDVLVGLDEEINELLSMAKIYCSAGKYSEARAILRAQQGIESDPRLEDALEQIDEMERRHN